MQYRVAEHKDDLDLALANGYFDGPVEVHLLDPEDDLEIFVDGCRRSVAQAHTGELRAIAVCHTHYCNRTNRSPGVRIRCASTEAPDQAAVVDD